MSAIDKKALRHEMYRKKIPRSYIVIFFALISFFVLVSYAVFGFYLEHWYTGPARTVARVLPIPAVLVDNNIVWYKEISEFANVFKVAEENSGIDVGDPFDTAMGRAVSNTHLLNFSNNLGVSISREDVQNYVIEDPDLDIFLKNVGWSESQYRRYIIEPLLLAQLSEEVVFADVNYQVDTLKRIQNVEQDLELGIPFNDLAIQYSDDLSASSGGFLGFFPKDGMPDGFDFFFDSELNIVSSIVETDSAFEIAQLYDSLEIGGQRSQVAIQIITIKKTGLSHALEIFEENQSVKYFVR